MTTGAKPNKTKIAAASEVSNKAQGRIDRVRENLDEAIRIAEAVNIKAALTALKNALLNETEITDKNKKSLERLEVIAINTLAMLTKVYSDEDLEERLQAMSDYLTEIEHLANDKSSILKCCGLLVADLAVLLGLSLGAIVTNETAINETKIKRNDSYLEQKLERNAELSKHHEVSFLFFAEDSGDKMTSGRIKRINELAESIHTHAIKIANSNSSVPSARL